MVQLKRYEKLLTLNGLTTKHPSSIGCHYGHTTHAVCRIITHLLKSIYYPFKRIRNINFTIIFFLNF